MSVSFTSYEELFARPPRANMATNYVELVQLWKKAQQPEFDRTAEEFDAWGREVQGLLSQRRATSI
jgi:hypothetical protein